MTIDARAIRRLEAMDIPVWLARAPRDPGAGDAPSRPPAPVEDFPTDASARGSDSRPGRVRLEAGSGRWLLVVDDVERARHANLIEDIRAALGTGDCRFGTWSDSPEAGVAIEDWEAHGIRHALVFGGQAGPGFVQGGDLATLASSGEARRTLWRRLRPLLVDLER